MSHPKFILWTLEARIQQDKLMSTTDHHDLTKEPKWPRIRNLPAGERVPFNKWLDGQARPMVEDTLQDGYFPWDYERWKKHRSGKFVAWD